MLLFLVTGVLKNGLNVMTNAVFLMTNEYLIQINLMVSLRTTIKFCSE